MKRTALMLSLAATMSSAIAADVATIDWSKIPSTTVSLFFPGQSSYEWLRKDHPGAPAVQADQPCVTCHKGQETKLGAKLVKGGPLEPTPVEGKTGQVDLKVQAAYDAKNAYFRLSGEAKPYPGGPSTSNSFDGRTWKVTASKLAKIVREGRSLAS